MENFRSMSCREGRVQMQSYNTTNNGENGDHNNRAPTAYPTNMQDLRSYSTSYASCPSYHAQNPNQLKVKKNQNQNQNQSKSNSRSSSSRGGGWSLTDPELQRKKRVASYKAYAVEGKMKGSLRRSFRWIKHTCSHVVYGWW